MHKGSAPFLFLSFALAISTFAPSVTHAQLSIGALVDTRGQAGYNRDNASSSPLAASTTSSESMNATTSEYKKTGDRAISASVSGQLIAHAHRSAVATFAESLLAVVDREGEQSAEMRIIAEAQKNLEATTTEAIQKIATRNSLTTFFVGSDYKNLEILRSEIVTTQNHLDQLNAILASTTDAALRTTLSTQISALALDQEHIQKFVATHEKPFGLFDWFVKLF